MKTETVKTIWKSYADSHGFIFETRDRNIAMTGKKTEIIIFAADILTIRGVFQLDITGWGQGIGPLNKTSVQIVSNEKVEDFNDKLNRKKFGYKKCFQENNILTFEYKFLFETQESFMLLDELLLVNKIKI